MVFVLTLRADQVRAEGAARHCRHIEIGADDLIPVRGSSRPACGSAGRLDFLFLELERASTGCVLDLRTVFDVENNLHRPPAPNERLIWRSGVAVGHDSGEAEEAGTHQGL